MSEYKYTPTELDEIEKCSTFSPKNKKDIENFPNIEEGPEAIDKLLEMVFNEEVDFWSLNDAEKKLVVDDINASFIEAEKATLNEICDDV